MINEKELVFWCRYCMIALAVAFLLVCTSIFTALEVQAAEATPSDAERLSGAVDDILKDLDWGDLDEMEQLELFSLYLDALSGPGIASASNASLENLESDVAAIRSYFVPVLSEDEEDLVDYALEGEADMLPFALTDEFSLDRNVVIYEGVWNGRSARLVLPASTADTLYISPSGIIYNVGTDTIEGRIFYGDFDPLDYECDVFFLTPCLGNNASTLYNYAYPNYCRHYYESGSRLTYSTVYGNFTVAKVIHTPSDLPAQVNGIYLLVLILMGGVVILCLWKK